MDDEVDEVSNGLFEKSSVEAKKVLRAETNNRV